METNILKKVDLNNETLICKKIIYAVDIQREAMRFALKHLSNSFA